MAELAHVRAGPRDRPTFVWVHGYLGGSDQWAREIAHFSQSYDVIAPNLPGFGGAADRAGENTISGMADAILGLLDALSVGDFILLGHSMGGMIAQEMARKRSQSVRKLILYGTGALGCMPGRFEPISTSRERLASDGVAATVDRIGANWFRDGAMSPNHPLVKEIGSKANLDAAMAALDAMETWDGRPALVNLGMPTLIVWGDADRSYDWAQVEQLWTHLPNAHLCVIPDAGHATHLEKPDLFQMHVEDFLTASP